MKTVGKVLSIVLLLGLAVTLMPTTLTPTAAHAQGAVACEEDVTVQADDWLSKLADKFYGDPLAFQAIAAATNAAATADSSYATIANVDLIEIGWKLCIPSATDAQALLANPDAAVTAGVEELPDIGTLQVGYIPIFAFAPFFVANEKGYFAEQGLTVELQSFRSGAFMMAPLTTGDLDAGGGETGPGLFNAIDQGLDIRVVSAMASQPPGFGAVPLLVRTDLIDSGTVSSVADLAGRKVALNVERGTAEYLLAKALEGAGLTVDDVEVVSLPFPEMPAAFANQAIDAAILPHPLASRAIGAGDAVALLEGDEITDTPQNGVIYFGQRLLQPENREIGVRFLIAYLKAARDLQGDGWRSDDNVAIINLVTNVPAPAIKNGVAYYFEPNGLINRASTEDFQLYHFNRGYTEMAAPLPLDQVIIDTYLDEALARLGRVNP
ncbi:MAG: ABC transporter substrate-binding protein [Anaerolineae bacterium]